MPERSRSLQPRMSAARQVEDVRRDAGPASAEPAGDARRVSALVGLLFRLAGTGNAAVAVTPPRIATDLRLTHRGHAGVPST